MDPNGTCTSCVACPTEAQFRVQGLGWRVFEALGTKVAEAGSPAGMHASSDTPSKYSAHVADSALSGVLRKPSRASAAAGVLHH